MKPVMQRTGGHLQSGDGEGVLQEKVSELDGLASTLIYANTQLRVSNRRSWMHNMGDQQEAAPPLDWLGMYEAAPLDWLDLRLLLLRIGCFFDACLHFRI